MSAGDTQLRSVYIWVCEGTWRASVDAALRLAPARTRFTVLHVTSAEAPDTARGAYAGLFGRACQRLEITGRAERAVVAASARADLLIVARDGDRARLGPKSPGKATRFVVDHAACPVLLVWPQSRPGVTTIPPPPQQPPPPGH